MGGSECSSCVRVMCVCLGVFLVCAVLVPVVLGEGEAHLADRGLGCGHLEIT